MTPAGILCGMEPEESLRLGMAYGAANPVVCEAAGCTSEELFEKLLGRVELEAV